MMKLIFNTLFLLVFIIGCTEKESSNNSTIDKVETKNQSVAENINLPPEATGIFTGEEPGYSMKFGSQIIEMPSSKWRIEISTHSLNMQQVSDGQTVHYSGKFNIESENEVSIVIKGDLLDDKYNHSFKPALRFNKDSKTWFLEGVAGSEGCILNKE